MQLNLLDKLYEKAINLFVYGLLCYNDFIIIEKIYFKKHNLFTINLN